MRAAKEAINQQSPNVPCKMSAGSMSSSYLRIRGALGTSYDVGDHRANVVCGTSMVLRGRPDGGQIICSKFAEFYHLLHIGCSYSFMMA